MGNSAAHAKAAAYVAGLSNSDIKIGCSDIYYNYTLMSPAITAKYNEAKSVLQAAGFTFVGNCAPLSKNPYTVVLSNYSSSITLDELQYHLTNNLQVNTSVFDVLLNGAFAFSTGLNPTGGRFTGAATSSGCGVWQVNKTVYDEYLDRVPANRSDVYNEYYNQNGVDLVMGPTHYCDYVKWSDDTQVTGSCNGTFFPGGSCMSKCMSVGVNGGRDKVFTKAKFVVPIGQTSTGGVMSLHFMSRAGPRNLAANVSASTWVYDEEGPKTWNLEEIYMVKRIYNVLAAAGMKRADAPMNFISGLF